MHPTPGFALGKHGADFSPRVGEGLNTSAVLHQLFPPQVVDKLRRGEKVSPEMFSSVSIMFADIVGWTTIANKCSPLQAHNLLGNLYSTIDFCLSHFRRLLHSSLSHIILTDSITRNVHLSEDYGGFFEQVFAADVYGLPDSATTTSCAVSQKGNSYALGWTDYPTATVFDCVSDSVSNCDGDWVKQVDCNSESGDYNTAGLALSQKGEYVFSTDAGTKEISVGKVSIV